MKKVCDEEEIYNAIIEEVIDTITEPGSIFNMRMQSVIIEAVRDAIDAIRAERANEGER